ncbi:MAG TPA: hypothetical protein DCF66_02480, partial [Lachnospiraceae bacterium]|nr:hypothetical protein [Lachnospiraceae bacterium]
ERREMNEMSSQSVHTGASFLWNFPSGSCCGAGLFRCLCSERRTCACTHQRKRFMRLRRQTCWKLEERSGSIGFPAGIGSSSGYGRGWMLRVVFKERCKRKVNWE